MTAPTLTDADRYAGPDHVRTPICPEWCVEHYEAEGGTQNHSGPINRGVVGESATDGTPMEMHVWPELRVTPDGHAYPVGILGETHREPDDFEMTPEQLRRLAAHCIAVAQMCERVIAERNAVTDASQPDSALLGRQ